VSLLATNLWDHQRRCVRGASGRPASLISAWMGGGKTLIAIALAVAWRSQRILVTCPLSVCSTWARELAEHAPGAFDVCVCDRGTSAVRAEKAASALELATARRRPCVVIVNHESAWRPEFGNLCGDARFDLLIVDESHRAKAPGGRFSKFLFRLARTIPRRLALTGTPLPHSPLDAYAQFRFLAPRIFGTSFHRFRLRYAIMGGYSGHEVVGFQNQAEFAELFNSITETVSKDEALGHLPPEVDLERRCELEPDARKIYSSLDRHFYAGVANGEVTATNALAKLLRLQQVTSGDLPIEDLEDPEAGRVDVVSQAKLTLLRDLLEDVDTREPVVVFCRFKRDLDRVEALANTFGRRYGELSGRRKDLDEGRMLPNVDLMGVQIQAGGVGIDLSRSALAFYYSTGFSLGDYLQSRARLFRPKQTRSVRYVHLLCEGTIDERVFGALKKREKVIESILRGGNHAQEGIEGERRRARSG
jgi:SNF2 family DNA or RNA helicase